MGNILKKFKKSENKSFSKLLSSKSHSSKSLSSKSLSSKSHSSKLHSSKSHSSKSHSFQSHSSKSHSSKSHSFQSHSSKSHSSQSSSQSISYKLSPKILLKQSLIQNKIVNQNYIDERYKIIKKLGTGLNGSVYLVEDLKNHKKYAYKIQKIFENDLLDNYKSLIVRQLDFYEHIIKKYPKQFMDIINYYITTDCTYQPDYNVSLIPKAYQKKALERIESKLCVHFIYSLIDNTIIDYILSWEKFNYKKFYSLFLQTLYIIYILDSNNYHHNDLHGFNIGIIHTHKEYINILDKKIPTYGNNIQIIDFDKVIHKKYYTNNNTLEETYRYSTDLLKILYSLLIISSYFPLFKKYKNINPKNVQAKCYIPQKYKDLINKDLNHIPINERNGGSYIINMLQVSLYKLYFPILYQKYVLKVNPVKVIYPISINDIKFIVQNLYDPEKVLKYFLEKIDF